MKKLEKDLILKDLDYVNNEYDIKTQKLKSIIDLYLDEEPDSVKDTIDEVIRQVEETEQNFENQEPEQKNDDNTTDNSDIVEVVDNDTTENLPPNIKTLYHKIVMITHPDKHKDNKNSDYHLEMYHRVIRAKEKNDKSEIIYVAYKLKLKEVYDVDDEHFDSIKEKIKKNQTLSKNLEYNSFWIWYHTENKELKKMMIDQINNMSKNK